MRKKLHCKQGHALSAPNLVFNKEGFRECRICRYAREAARKRDARSKASAKAELERG